MGLIDMAPNRYTRVAVPAEEETIPTSATSLVLMGGAVRQAVPRLTPAERAKIAGKVERLAGQMTAAPWEDARHGIMPTFALYVEKTGLPYERLCANSLDGLAYRTRTALLPDILDREAISRNMLDLRDATMAGDGLGAQRAIECVRQLDP